jgi:hypothetical protein
MSFKGRTLVIQGWDAGFFSNFNGVLNNLRYRLGRRDNSAVVVDWRVNGAKSEFPYGRPEDGNLWERYFEPLSFEHFPSKTLTINTFASSRMTGRLAYAMYKLNRHWRQDYNVLYRRHIRIRSEILERAEEIYRDGMSGRYCAGAHYRNPDHAVECLHSIPGPEAFVARLRALLPADRPWVVFLASDYEPAVTVFQDAFGDRLLLQPDVRRSRSRAEGNIHHANGAPSLALGQEVLVDCLLLARCDLLLHVTSNVATAAGCINPAMRMVYCETPAQAAWGFVWSLLFSSPPVDGLIHWTPLACRAAIRRIRNSMRWLSGARPLKRPAP